VDAWFVGFIPQLTTSVWVGYPDERRSMVNINGLPEINGENYPLDIWSLYMQDAVMMFPEQQFDVPSPYLDLQIKTDGRAVAPVESTTEDTDDTTESTEGTGPEDNPDEPARPGAQLASPSPQSASPSPQSASPAPQSASPAPRAAPPLRPAPGGPGPSGEAPRR
jgi:penicillin-binding protein 1A